MKAKGKWNLLFLLPFTRIAQPASRCSMPPGNCNRRWGRLDRGFLLPGRARLRACSPMCENRLRPETRLLLSLLPSRTRAFLERATQVLGEPDQPGSILLAQPGRLAINRLTGQRQEAVGQALGRCKARMTASCFFPEASDSVFRNSSYSVSFMAGSRSISSSSEAGFGCRVIALLTSSGAGQSARNGRKETRHGIRKLDASVRRVSSAAWNTWTITSFNVTPRNSALQSACTVMGTHRLGGHN